MKTLRQNDSLSQYMVTEKGVIRFNIPDGIVPDFLAQAFNGVSQGQLKEVRSHLTDENVARIDQQAAAKKQGSLFCSLLLAIVWQRLGDLPRALDRYQCIREQESHPLVLNELAELYVTQGQPSKALAMREEALALNPSDVGVETNLALDQIQLGHIKEGVSHLQALLDQGHLTLTGHSSLLWNLHYLADVDRQTMLDAHVRWGKFHAPVQMARQSFENIPDPDKKLRVGYLSADFNSHAVAYVFDALLQGHDRSVVELFGYGNVHNPDQVTQYLANMFDTYRSILGVDDASVVDLIQRDQVDILVATAGHTCNHRLKVLAYKPAPIQIDLGGIDTTGIEQVDYRFTDEHLDPPGSEKWYVEKTVYLSGGALRYAVPQGANDVGPLPAQRNGYVTFCSFNNHLKINEPVIALWSQILLACPGSKILLKFKAASDPVIRQHFLDCFSGYGIVSERVILQAWCSHQDHWHWYNQADIALDTYPFNGCITTLESLWMGLPVVSMAGLMWVSRMGLSVLSNVGFEAFVAQTPEQFVAKALALASNLEALERLRFTMRQRMGNSPLCDCRGFAQDMENAYRKVWQQWCQVQ